MVIADAEREMNDESTDLIAPRPASLWRNLAVVSGVLLFLGVGAIGGLAWFNDAKTKRTATIIETIEVGFLLAVATHDSAILRITFDDLKGALGQSNALRDLELLSAIDDRQKCFIDAWGNPLNITTKEGYCLDIHSAGKDRIVGTRDDIR